MTREQASIECQDDFNSVLEYVKKDYTIISNIIDYNKAIKHIEDSQFLAYDTETNGLNVRRDRVIGFSFSGAAGVGFYLPIFVWNLETKTLDRLPYIPDSWVKYILDLLLKKDLLMWNASFDIRITKNNLKVDLSEALIADVMLMKHTVMEEGEFSLKGVAIQFQNEIGLDMERAANEEQIELKANIEKNGGSATKTNYELYKADLEVIGKYACADTDLTFRLGEFFLDWLERENLSEFFFDDEVMPLYKEVTIPMEDKGVALDIGLMERTRIAIEKDMEKYKEEVIDTLFCDERIDKYYTDLLNTNYPATNRGKFVQAICEKFKVPLPTTKSGRFSITSKTVTDMPESPIKTFLISGDRADIPIDVDITDIQHKLHMKEEGVEFNILSKKQMGDIVFGILKHKPLSKTKNGQDQFDEDMIQKLDEDGVEWAKYLSDYNKLTKIKSTYIDRFLEVQEDGRFYPSFFQHRTISGRYGSDMQQLSRPKEDGELRPTVLYYNNLIRSFFIAGDGRKFVDNDYESLEPHVFAHVSGDEGLRDIFRKGHDFYSTIAIATEGLSQYSADKKAENYLGKHNKQKRQSAKAYSLGVPYGMTSYALAMTLGVHKDEGERLVKSYLDAYPDLKKWMKESEMKVKLEGSIKVETGRVRHLPKVKELYKKYRDTLLDYKQRAILNKKLGKEETLAIYRDYKNGVNNAKNVQIQGLSASIVNRAAIAINRKFKELGINGWVSLQIHDQLVMEVPEDRAKECAVIVQDIMENNYKLSLKLKAVPQIADNLKEGH